MKRRLIQERLAMEHKQQQKNKIRIQDELVHTTNLNSELSFHSTPETEQASFNPEEEGLLEKILSRENMQKAVKRVISNKGAAGIDGMEVGDLVKFLIGNWIPIKEQLLAGTYKPRPIRSVEIPKPSGGTRKLGIPTVVDRMLQQAIMQILTPIFDPDFSESSYGFRPKRNAQMAITKAKKYQEQGYIISVDLDLEKFFDNVNHDILMATLAKKIKDKRVLKLIRKYLQTGVMKDGLAQQEDGGTIQGSPLSPLLSNIVLDKFDKEMEKRSHKFCRYADDITIFVKTKRAGERVLSSVKCFLEKKIKLRINETKSKVDFSHKRKFLGYSFLGIKTPRIRIAKESIKRFKTRVKEITRGHRSENIESRISKLRRYMQGWMAYFKLVETVGVIRDLDSWIRHRLRMCMLKQWRKPKTRIHNLIKQGITLGQALMYASKGRYWFLSDTKGINFTLNNAYWAQLGYKPLAEIHLGLNNVS